MSVESRLSLRQDLGLALLHLREEAGLSQDALRLASGVAQSRITAYETGRAAPNYVTLHALAEALGVQASAIVSRAETNAALARTRASRSR
ncbi:MAG TPA: helix-turn-helix transcriptional regulator [Conexibacter sp.]